MNKQQLSSKVWKIANSMRANGIEANEYKDFILGFIFYKFVSDNEVKYVIENNGGEASVEVIQDILSDQDESITNSIKSELGYFIAYENLYTSWINKGRDFTIQDVRIGLSAFESNIDPNAKKLYKDIFESLETSLSKLGSETEQRKSIIEILNSIKEIPTNGKDGYDVLGYIYEDLIGMFAANAGKKAGEFYTPHEVSVLMSEIVANHLVGRDTIEIYDPTSGSGSLLINIGESIKRTHDEDTFIKYYAQELNKSTYNLTRMNLIMRGIESRNIVVNNANTLKEDWPVVDGKVFLLDAVVSNPPYSAEWDPPQDRNADQRYKYGLAPQKTADYAFLLHDLYHLKSDGIMTIVLPHGVLFRGKPDSVDGEGFIRKNLIDNGHIDTIIGLPSNIFFGTGIPTIIMILKQNRTNSDVLFIDASKHFTKIGKNNSLRASDIQRIVDTVSNREDVEKFARVVSLQEIKDNDYNLNIPRYVNSNEEVENIDLYASMFGGIPAKELNSLEKYWNVFSDLKDDLFYKTNAEYYQVKQSNIEESIEKHSNVIEFNNKYHNVLEDLKVSLKESLITNIDIVDLRKVKEPITQMIFDTFNEISIIDKYSAFQAFDNNWQNIIIDLESIKSEGIDVCNIVETKFKTDNKGIEKADGYEGIIMPFELIQKHLLITDFKELNSLKTTQESNIISIEEIVESISEEEKENDLEYIKDKSFKADKLATRIKQLKQDKTEDNSELLESLINAENLMKHNKELAKIYKSKYSQLQDKTKEIIESLSIEQIYKMLEIKWVDSIIDELKAISEQVIRVLTNKLNTLVKKYSITFNDLEKDIQKTQNELCEMLADLNGNEFDMKALAELQKILKDK